MAQEAWEARVEAAELRHETRRRRWARVYRVVERVFFGALVLLALLIFLKFGSTVLPEYFR